MLIVLASPAHFVSCLALTFYLTELQLSGSVCVNALLSFRDLGIENRFPHGQRFGLGLGLGVAEQLVTR